MAVTDQNGKAVKEYDYSPYGELLLGENDGRIPFLYNGQYGVATDDNGLYYMRARYYNVDIKRFVNQDVLAGTLERISSLNRYSYVEGNPVSFLDPFGLNPYDTTNMHAGATVLSLVGFVFTLFPATAPIGVMVSVGASGFDLGLTFYDIAGKIKSGNTEELLLDINNIVIDLIGIITAGMSNGYFKTAQVMDSYGGIMGGYVHELGRLYSEWNYADGVVSKAGFFYQIKSFVEYLDKKIRKGE